MTLSTDSRRNPLSSEDKDQQIDAGQIIAEQADVLHKYIAELSIFLVGKKEGENELSFSAKQYYDNKQFPDQKMTVTKRLDKTLYYTLNDQGKKVKELEFKPGVFAGLEEKILDDSNSVLEDAAGKKVYSAVKYYKFVLLDETKQPIYKNGEIGRFWNPAPRMFDDGMQNKGLLLKGLYDNLRSISNSIEKCNSQEDLNAVIKRLENITKAITLVTAKPRYPIISQLATWFSRLLMIGLFIWNSAPNIPTSYRRWKELFSNDESSKKSTEAKTQPSEPKDQPKIETSGKLAEAKALSLDPSLEPKQNKQWKSKDAKELWAYLVQSKHTITADKTKRVFSMEFPEHPDPDRRYVTIRTSDDYVKAVTRRPAP